MPLCDGVNNYDILFQLRYFVHPNVEQNLCLQITAVCLLRLSGTIRGGTGTGGANSPAGKQLRDVGRKGEKEEKEEKEQEEEEEEEEEEKTRERSGRRRRTRRTRRTRTRRKRKSQLL